MLTNTTKLTARDSSFIDADNHPAFVVRNVDGGTIQGDGDTAEAAWADAVARLDSAGITVVDAAPQDHTQVLASSLVVLGD